MPCQNCTQNCGDKLSSDKCIIYTGADIPILGICTGDTLLEWEEAVVTKLEEALTGTAITLPDVTLNCSFLTAALGTNSKTLANLIQLLLDNQCTLRSLIPAVSSATFNIRCLEGLSSNPTKDQILQSVIDKLCTYVIKVDGIAADYVKASQLNTLIDQHLQDVAGNVIQWNTRMIPGVPLPYLGLLSSFDSSGKGLLSKGFDKVYLCNGLNGTTDLRGRVLTGANNGVPGATLDPSVSPTTTGVSIGIKQPVGEYKHALNSGENAPHTHTVSDPGHIHNTKYTGVVGEIDHSRGSSDFFFDNPTAGNYNSGFVLNAKTGITIASSGNGTPHNNIQPSIGCSYIIYIP